MTGLTIVGPAAATQITQDGEGSDLKLQGLRSMALVFMASRLVLACQYIVVMVSLRRFVRARSALIMYSGTLFAVAMVFLGVSFIFNREGAVKVGATVFYPIILFEFAIMCVISCRAHFMDLRNTIIVERLGLLTLIILGEGVIGLCTAISRVDVDFSFSADVIGMIVCAILIIYFIWMLYFDQVSLMCHLPIYRVDYFFRPKQSMLGQFDSRFGLAAISHSMLLYCSRSKACPNSLFGGRWLI